MRILCIAVLALIFVAGGASAEPYPKHTDIFVNDLADIIAPDAEGRIRDRMAALKAETGVEMTVLTIASRADYDATPSIEGFAMGVFNGWGVGGKDRNDGILILIAQADREMRIQLGAGYNQGYDVLAQDIVSRFIVPEFRDGRLSEGIETGVTEAEARIARPFAAKLPPQPLPAAGNGIPGWPIGLGGVVLIGLLAFRRRIVDAAAGFRRCPQCGSRGLHRHSEVITAATTTVPGLRRDITTCPNCSYADRRDSSIPLGRGPGGSSGNSFGGGKSSGGGATGRW
jgi:uncharacterized protein